MPKNSRLIAVLLLCTMAAGVPGFQAFALTAAPVHAAGCHGQGPANPAPASPPNYQCCVNGHHWTIPSSSFSVRPPLAEFCGRGVGEDFFLTCFLIVHSGAIIVPASSPPGPAPLRI